MERWMLLAMVVAVFSGLYHVCTKLSAGKIPDILGGIWLEGASLVLMGLYVLVMRQPIGNGGVTRAGLLYALLGGVCVAIVTVLNFRIYRLEGPLSAAGPIVLCGAIVVMSVVGVVFMNEPLTPSRSLGWIFAAAAIWLLMR